MSAVVDPVPLNMETNIICVNIFIISIIHKLSVGVLRSFGSKKNDCRLNMNLLYHL